VERTCPRVSPVGPPGVWIRPTPLSVKSEVLMTRAHGAGFQALGDVLPVLLVPVMPGFVLGVGDRADEFGDPVPELIGHGGDCLGLFGLWGLGPLRGLRPRRGAVPHIWRRSRGLCSG